MRVFVLLFVLALAGCSTPYQDGGFTGGVNAVPISNDTYRIQARGNAFTSPTLIQDYVLLKAAETTRNAGATHFVILNSHDRTGQSTIYTPGQAETRYRGNTASTTYTAPTATQFVKPGSDVMIKVFYSATAPVPPGALEAAPIIRNISARVNRG